MRRYGPGLIWTPSILLMTPIEYPLHSFSTFQYFLFKCIGVPGMCPEPRWIDYPAPRSPADSFVMAGPIRHCLLRACIINYVIIWNTCKWLIPPMPFVEKTIFVTEKEIICKIIIIIIIIIIFFFLQKITLFVPEKDVTIIGNYVAITL